MVNRDEFCAVRESGLDLNFVDHFRNAFHDLIAIEQCGAMVHQLCHGLTVTGAFQKRCRQIGDRFWMV